MKYKILILFFVVLWTTAFGHAQDGKVGNKYRWPLDINNGYSSTFQEFRSNHFHAGIDLRTFQTTGYPVYAIADGCIVRMRMVKSGSGKSLYLKHSDGNTSIYFHLDKFEPKLQALVKRIQQSKGLKYFGDFYPRERLCYKRGELIAYAGESGFGFPHLHLEIKSPRQFSLNPFQLLDLPSHDKNAPALKGLLFRNIGSSSLNGGIGDVYFPFKRTKYNHYVVPKPIVITGPFDLVLNARDITDSGRYAAPYQISAAVDEQDYFDLKFDRFQWDDNNQLGFVYDMSYSNPSSFYFNLFFQEGFSLESKNTPFKNVIDALTYGEHKLKIHVRDNFNNESTGELTFYKAKKPGLQVSGFTVDRNEIRFVVENLDTGPVDAIDTITLALKNKDGRTVYSGQFKYKTISEQKEFILKGSFGGVYFIDFNFLKGGLIYFKKRFLLKDDWLNTVKNIAFTAFCHRDEVFIKISQPVVSPDNLRLTVVQGTESQEINAESANDLVYFHFTPLNFTHKVLLNFAIIKGGQEEVKIQESLSLVYLKRGMKQVFKYEEFAVEFDTRAVYEPKTLLVEEKDFHSQYPILSKQISLSPTYFSFLDNVRCTFKKDLPSPQQVGIFKYDERYKGWGYRNTTYNKAAATYSHNILTPGVYALMRDVFPPRVFLRKIQTHYKISLKRLDIGMSDVGKGINDAALKVRLNGVLLDVDYDPDWRAVYIENENLYPLKIGKNVLDVEVRDHAWNKTSKTFTFNLK